MPTGEEAEDHSGYDEDNGHQLLSNGRQSSWNHGAGGKDGDDEIDYECGWQPARRLEEKPDTPLSQEGCLKIRNR
jgi:hypothetical protein